MNAFIICQGLQSSSKAVIHSARVEEKAKKHKHASTPFEYYS